MLAVATLWICAHALLAAEVSQQQFGVLAFALVAILSLLAMRRIRDSLIALPFLIAAMTAPEISGLRFLREFGNVALIVLLGRLALDVFTQNRMAIANLRNLFSNRAFLLLCIYFLVSVPAWLAAVFTQSTHVSKVVTNHLAIEFLAVVLVGSMAMAGQAFGARALKLTLDSVFALALVIVTMGLVGTLTRLYVSTPLTADSFFGLYYFCRLKLTFTGPVPFGTFLAVLTPILFLFVSTGDQKWKQRAAFCALALIPLLIIASGSRSSRIEFLMLVGIAILFRDTRKTALAIGLWSAILLVPTMPYRCFTDILYLTISQVLPPELNGFAGGVVPFDVYLEDPDRSSLYGNLIAFLMPGDLSPLAYLGRLLFGAGAGLSMYSEFSLGTHTAYLDTIIDKGILGFVFLAASITFAVKQLNLTAPSVPVALQKMRTAILLAFSPLVLVASVWDVRGWLFFWFFLGLIFMTHYAVSNQTTESSTNGSDDPRARDWLADPNKGHVPPAH